jgi:arylsulfatase A-like enzyme
VPAEYGEPFASEPAPAWLDEAVRAAHWQRPGPHSAQETLGFDVNEAARRAFPRQPVQIDSPAAVRAMFDGYDTGVRWADDHVGRIVEALGELGVADETAIFVSSDHGETLGELATYCDHHFADECTARVPAILRWPGLEGGRADGGLHYQMDLAATLLELAGATVPSDWDARSVASALRKGREQGREQLVLSQGAWTCQRSVRFERWLALRTYHDGFHALPDVMLFDVEADPHEQLDLAAKRPDVVAEALARLDSWHAEAMRGHPTGVDPLWSVIHEGGPWHVRGQLPRYLERLRATGRERWADEIARRHGAAGKA